MRQSLLAALLACAAPAAHASCETAAADLMSIVEIGGYRDGLSLSPDGAYAAFATRTIDWESDDVSHRISVLPLQPRGIVRHVADAGGVILNDEGGRTNGAALDRVPLWSPDGAWLAYLVRSGERVELWRVRANGGEASPIYAGGENVAAFAWLSAHTLVLNLRPPRAELAQRQAQAITSGFRIDSRFDAAYALRPMPQSQGRSVVVDVAGGHPRPATAAETARLEPAPSRVVRPLDPDDDAFLPIKGVFSGRRRCSAEACSGTLRDGWRVDERIYFLRGEDFANVQTALYEWIPRTGAVRLVRRAEDVLRACAPSGRRLICFREASLEPRHVIAIDLDSGAQEIIHQPNPDWPAHTLTPVERLDVVDSYGNESFAYLVYPQEYQPGRTYPAVVVQYRARGFLNGGVGGEFPIHAFAACGYFVFAVERPDAVALMQRLPVMDFMRQTELDHSEQLSKLSALGRLLDAAAARGLIDPSRLAITGLSDGAETLYWALTRTDRFAVAVAASPPVDPFIWSLAAEEFRRANLRAAGMTAYLPDAPPEWRRWWEANSPRLNIEHIRAPLLLQLGESEALHAMPLYARLRDREHPVEAYIYPGAQHIKWRPQQILASRRRAMAWIDFWLRDEINEDPTDPDRRARWTALRAAVAASPTAP